MAWSGYIWIFRPMNDKNHLPPDTGYHENSINNTDNMSSLRRPGPGSPDSMMSLEDIHSGDEKWISCDKTLRSCLLMPGWKKTNKMLVMQHWDCWIESAHQVSATELFKCQIELLKILMVYLWHFKLISTLDKSKQKEAKHCLINVSGSQQRDIGYHWSVAAEPSHH